MGALEVVSIADLRTWADAVIAMPVVGPWPVRVVLVPDEPHAHALRAELVERAPGALIGTRFLTAAAAARMVLDAAGVIYQPNEEERRRLRIRKLLRAGPSLRTYRAEQLRSRGWEDAFAETIEQLEAAALRPEDLEALDEARASDLAEIWRALEEDAGASWTVHRILHEASLRLEVAPEAWPSEAAVLALVPPFVDAVHVRFLRALPRIVLGIAPQQTSVSGCARVRALFGDVAAELVTRRIERAGARELDLLASHLFAAPVELAKPERGRSAGPDGSVALEVHAGVDEEIAATMQWVAAEVLRGTPLQDIAIVVARAEPMAMLVADRLEALGWPEGVRPVYLPAGRPATTRAAGARLLALVRTIAAYLPADELTALLPRLRRQPDAPHLTPEKARLAIARMGTIGGAAARSRDALVWRERASRLDDDERFIGLRAAVTELVAIVELVLQDATLPAIWEAIVTFARAHLIVPGELDEILDPLDRELSALIADHVTEDVVGADAVELVAERLMASRLHEGRHGEASIYVGAIDGAAGLSFTAVRVLGLAESVFPGTLREDAVLPREVRKRLPALASDEDYATARLRALAQLVRDTRERIVFSTSRTDLDGSEREPAALFVELAAALGRPDRVTGQRRATIPSLVELERDAFAPARDTLRRDRPATAVNAAAWLDVVATDRAALPSAWSMRRITDPFEVEVRAASMHGVLGPASLTVAVPGFAPERSLSASSLRDLLECPQRFLLRHVLGLFPRSEPPETHRLTPSVYGKLVHRVLEAFLREHGSAFGARERDLAAWLEVAAGIADQAFDALLERYPLRGDGAIRGERARLHRDVETLLDDDWNDGRPRRFVAAEHAFQAVPIAMGDDTLFVDGRIDRIDVDDGVTLVRDLKTGRPVPRRGRDVDPSVEKDLQLAVYVAATTALAGELGVPADVAAAYAYVDHLAPSRERGFREDRARLRAESAGWFDLAARILRAHAFVQTTDPRACGFCAYAPVCGDRREAPAVAPRPTVVDDFLELHR